MLKDTRKLTVSVLQAQVQFGLFKEILLSNHSDHSTCQNLFIFKLPMLMESLIVTYILVRWAQFKGTLSIYIFKHRHLSTLKILFLFALNNKTRVLPPLCNP